VLVLPNGPEFFPAFYGIQLAGGTAVPVFPGFSPDRILNMARLCEARFIVVPSETPTKSLTAFRQTAVQHELTLTTTAEAPPAKTADFPLVEPDDVAFIQYTSGSTDDPKGVQLSHHNLLTNVCQMIAGMAITAEEIFVSWLPVYHDMGLILKTMVPFYLAAQIHLLPTTLTDVRPWLEAIQSHRATFTAAPDFAYRLLLRYIANPADYNLSSLRVALNAAEPVRAQTISDFEAAFNLQNVMVAGYGLAEATVGVSMWPPGTPPKVDEQGHVSAGPPFPEIELSIVQDGRLVEARQIGEIAINSPANTRGYYNNPASAAALYYDERTILSGDLGYLDEAGNLFIVGRKKNIIKHGGQTVYPQEVEEVVNEVTGVRYSAAVGLERGRLEGEQVTIFAEVRGDETTPEAIWYDTAVEIAQRFRERFGFRPGHVYLVRPKTIPLTHNGKLQHGRLRDMFMSGELARDGRILYPA
jgi:acyl-CoA synthetase (AMP-forming)/AMP-acid ligase II